VNRKSLGTTGVVFNYLSAGITLPVSLQNIVNQGKKDKGGMWHPLDRWGIYS
jgi:hypothetical protein